MIKEFFYTRHALHRMFERSIQQSDIEAVIRDGEIINEYPEDRPYPSFLSLKMIKGRPLHVVYSYVKDDLTDTCIVITVYEPSVDEWSADFKKRRTEK